MTYRSSQEQVNEIIGFGMTFLVMGMIVGWTRSIAFEVFEPQNKSPELLPHTRGTGKHRENNSCLEREFAGRKPPLPEPEGWPTTEEDIKLGKESGYPECCIRYYVESRFNPDLPRWSHPKKGYMVCPGHAGELRARPAGTWREVLKSPGMLPHILLPQTVPVQGGERITPEYRDLVGWVDEPLPEYGLLTLPAVVPDEKERRIDAVLKQLKEGVESIQDSQLFRLFLTTMAKFHDYSIGNQILIMLQKPDATRVAGFNTWKDLGRWVRSGEKGIAILAPVMPPRPTCPNCDAKIYKGVRFCPQCGKEVEADKGFEGTPRFFRVVYVFDLSQTDGKPLPEFSVPVLTGEANEELFSGLLSLMRKRGVAVSFEPRPEIGPDTKGFFRRPDYIWVRPEEPMAQQLKTLLHEVAHYYSEDVFHTPRQDAETIAESAAFVVGAHFGFDTGVRSFPYVALWARDKKALENNLGAIREVSTTIIESLEEIRIPV